MTQPTIDDFRARLGVPEGELAHAYVHPPEWLDEDEGCINCGGQTMAIGYGCDLHCEGCCDCDLEDDND